MSSEVIHKTIETSVHIGRDNHNVFHIEVRDELSGLRIVRVNMTPEQFAMAITGVYQSGYKTEIDNRLHLVGKKKVRENRTAVTPFTSFDSDVLTDWLIENCQEEGWILDTYLGSQGSKFTVDGVTNLRYSVYKFVEA